MGPGGMPGGFRWDVDGAGSAQRRDIRVRFHRRRNCGSSATLVMRRDVGGCRGSECGIRCGLRRGSWVVAVAVVGAFRFGMYASAGIVPQSMGRWSLIWKRRDGLSPIAMAGCSGWRSVFWNRTWRRGASRSWRWRQVRAGWNRVTGRRLPRFARRTPEGSCPHISDC